MSQGVTFYMNASYSLYGYNFIIKLPECQVYLLTIIFASEIRNSCVFTKSGGSWCDELSISLVQVGVRVEYYCGVSCFHLLHL